jgi:hypothetical protein
MAVLSLEQIYIMEMLPKDGSSYTPYTLILEVLRPIETNKLWIPRDEAELTNSKTRIIDVATVLEELEKVGYVESVGVYSYRITELGLLVLSLNEHVKEECGL